MSIATASYFQPIVRNEYLDRLEAFAPGSNMSEDFWSDVHIEAQQNLEALDDEVRLRIKDILVTNGQTKGRSFLLFTHRTYSVPEGSIDPVVVGMTFTPTSGGVAIAADISGEETGDLVSSLSIQIVPTSREALMQAAGTLARKLCQSSAAIVGALENPSRKVE